ncbi:hypothetical protein [Streptomyces sp. NPDC054786]
MPERSRRRRVTAARRRCPPYTWPTGRILPVRIDLARSAGTDFERVVLTIRLALPKSADR